MDIVYVVSGRKIRPSLGRLKGFIIASRDGNIKIQRRQLHIDQGRPPGAINAEP